MRPDTKLRDKSSFYSEHGTQFSPAKKPGIAKDVHQQSVGAVRTIQLTSAVPVPSTCNPSRTGVALAESFLPLRAGANCFVRSVDEVSMRRLFFLVDHAGNGTITQLVASLEREFHIPLAKLPPQTGACESVHPIIVGEYTANQHGALTGCKPIEERTLISTLHFRAHKKRTDSKESVLSC